MIPKRTPRLASSFPLGRLRDVLVRSFRVLLPEERAWLRELDRGGRARGRDLLGRRVAVGCVGDHRSRIPDGCGGDSDALRAYVEAWCRDRPGRRCVLSGTSLSGLRGKSLPAWLCWAGLLLSIPLLLAAFRSGLPALAARIWVLALALVLLWQVSRAESERNL